jgi:fatty acid CoA ligase FadD9
MELSTQPETDGGEQSLAQTVAAIMARYARRPALGDRAQQVITDPATGRAAPHLLPEFHTISYGQLWSKVGAVAADWHHDPRAPLHPGDTVALIGFASTDYTIVDLACLYLGTVSVPLQSCASLAQLRPILDETDPRVLAVGLDSLDKAIDLLLGGITVPRLLVFDYHPDIHDQRERLGAARDRLTKAGIATVIDTLAEVLDRGATLPAAPPHTPLANEDPLSLLIYTSGSTGTPKGAMYPAHLVRGMWSWMLPADMERPVCLICR